MQKLDHNLDLLKTIIIIESMTARSLTNLHTEHSATVR